MKKLVVSLFAAVLLTAGLVSVGETAHAAGYSAATPILSVYHPNIKKLGLKGTVRVSVIGGATTPKGTLSLHFQGPGKNLTEVLPYNGTRVIFRVGKLKHIGRYKIWVTYTSSSRAYTNVGPQRFGFIKVRNLDAKK